MILQPALVDTYCIEMSFWRQNLFLGGCLIGGGIKKAAQMCSVLAESHSRNAANIKSKRNCRDLN